MGIDPVTHSPLDRESSTETERSIRVEAPTEADQTNSADNINQPENCSQYSHNNTADVSASCLWVEDIPLTDASWKFPSNDVNSFPLDASCDWLTDYQDLGLVDLESIGS